MKEMEPYQGRQPNRTDGLWNSNKQNNQLNQRGNINNHNKSYNEEYNTHFKDLQNNDNIKKKEINPPIFKNYNNIQPYSHINNQKKKKFFFNNFTNKASNINNINKDSSIEGNINRNCENWTNNTIYGYDGNYLPPSLYNNNNNKCNYKFNNLNMNSHHINKNNMYMHNNIIHEEYQNVNNMQQVCNIASNSNIKYRNKNNYINNFNKNGKKRKLIMTDRVNNFEKKHKLEDNSKDENEDIQNSFTNLVPNLENKLNINSSNKCEENEDDDDENNMQPNELYTNYEPSQNSHTNNITKTMDIDKHDDKTNENYIDDNPYKIKQNDILKNAIDYFSNINKYKNEELNSDDDSVIKFDEDNKNMCYVCKKNMYIYKCPFCEARTCCLECSKNHKKLFNCKNKLKKDFKIKHIGRNNFNDELLYKDFLFLQNVEKIVEGNYKFIKVNDYENKSNIWGYYRDKKVFHIFKQKKIHLLKAPIYTTLHKTNKTCIRNSIIYWTVKVTFSNLNFFITRDNVSENSTFLQLLNTLCTKTESLQSKLSEFFKNLGSLRIYLKNGTKVEEPNNEENKIDNNDKDVVGEIPEEQNDQTGDQTFEEIENSQKNECDFFSVKHTINYALINQSFYEYPHFFFEILYENDIPIPNPLYKDSSTSK
ncbi:zinc finger protein, putative [Plasmodium chabaudi chabaudi]|uniref:Zinc finger protein, putative n=1 Tax=Plasmodium chabaudi chabaudi TaxID=31271 RepID=A0A4V0K990_PLACU|nr:zinc finger protein, putative [Plasmodium chabaudi chabaudi]VTZ69741.1 zinc finger protein, putative [Plasmodium chabaudi chabaudi]|eukprot:XP_016654283.1 conserved Plasmodium protein, unknown function [Plasmodium chabaudi chabaudi]